LDAGVNEEVFANPRSDRVKTVRNLIARAGRMADDRRVVAEGPQAVREAVAAGCVGDLWLTPEWDDREVGLAFAVRDAGGYVHLATRAVLDAMSAAAQGVLAICTWPDVGLAQVLADGPPDLVAVFEDARDPGNAGSAIRAADAAGASLAIFTVGCVDPRSAKVIRSSAGSFFHLAVAGGVPLDETLVALSAAGCQILAADGAGRHDLLESAPPFGDMTHDDGSSPSSAGGLGLDLSKPTVWLFGNEARGLSEEAMALADASVRIPIFGRAESLNVAMAATLCLYASAQAQGNR